MHRVSRVAVWGEDLNVLADLVEGRRHPFEDLRHSVEDEFVVAEGEERAYADSVPTLVEERPRAILVRNGGPFRGRLV